MIKQSSAMTSANKRPCAFDLSSLGYHMESKVGMVLLSTTASGRSARQGHSMFQIKPFPKTDRPEAYCCYFLTITLSAA
jgi:hypothetical protein